MLLDVGSLVLAMWEAAWLFQQDDKELNRDGEDELQRVDEELRYFEEEEFQALLSLREYFGVDVDLELLKNFREKIRLGNFQEVIAELKEKSKELHGKASIHV